MDTKRKVFVVLGSVAVIAVAGATAGALFFGGDSTTVPSSGSSLVSDSTSSTDASSTGSDQTSTTTTPTTGTYADGTYTASASYRVPHGYSNSIRTNLTVKDGTVTAVDVQNDASDRESESYIDWFEQELESEVVGKSLADLSPSRIGGASLTTDAFDQTLDTIRDDATA